MSHKTLLNIKNLSISFANKVVIDKLSLSVGKGEIIALIGANGSGKTTLLNAILQVYDPDLYSRPDYMIIQGEIQLAKGTDLSYLPQELPDEVGEFNINCIYGGKKSYVRIANAFGMNQLLDFPQNSPKNQNLSDGERQKLAIMEVLLSDADLLFLDEPTNYLDIVGLNAFEEQILLHAKKGKGILIVSHDRTLINNVSDRTYYLTPNGIMQTEGGYSAAWSLATSTYKARLKQAGEIRKKIAHLQDEMRSRMNWASQKEKSKKGAGSEKPTIAKQAKKMAARAQSARKKAGKQLDHLEKIKPSVPRQVKIRLPKYSVRHRDVFSLKGISFAYSGSDSRFNTEKEHEILLEGVELTASTNSKYCIMGANGSGKSTLFNIVLGRLKPLSGAGTLNKNVRLGYVPQGLKGFFEESSLLENFHGTGVDETSIRHHLGSVLIRQDKVHEPLGNFSCGELMRAALVKCILMQSEFLFLDEPTSHLDIESVELLEHLLSQFPGGYLIISHDRTFLEHVADTLFLLEDRKLKLV